MRATLSILFSALLLWAQTVAPAHAGVVVAKASSCCGCQCGERSCCDPRPPAPTQPSPLSLLRAVSREDKALKVSLHAASRSVPAPAPESFQVPSLPVASAAMPLYRRDCALLL